MEKRKIKREKETIRRSKKRIRVRGEIKTEEK